jgi:hypothetical protein
MDNNYEVKQKVMEAIKILETIGEVLLENDIVSSSDNTLQSLLSEFELNPQYGQITVDSCFVIEEFYHIPDRIYTPIGYIKIPKRTYAGSLFNKNILYTELKSKLDIQLIKPAEQTRVGLIGGWFKIGDGEIIYKERKKYIDFLDSYGIFERCLRSYMMNK